MTRFKKIAPLFLAAAFTFASAPAFSQFKFPSTSIPECDQYLQAYGVEMVKLSLEMYPNMPDSTLTELTKHANQILKDESKKIRDKIERGIALGAPIIPMLKEECQEELNFLNRK